MLFIVVVLVMVELEMLLNSVEVVILICFSLFWIWLISDLVKVMMCVVMLFCIIRLFVKMKNGIVISVKIEIFDDIC